MTFIYNTLNCHFRSDIFWSSLDFPKIGGNLGIADGIEAILVMMLLFNWCFGITAGFKFCCDELDKLESEEQIKDEDDERLENENKTSLKEETEI
jgi:hypothetical protein